MYRLGINPEQMYYFNEEDIDKAILLLYVSVKLVVFNALKFINQWKLLGI